MVHGRYLQPRTVSEGQHSMQLNLTVHEKITADKIHSATRQAANTDAMLRGPWSILKKISDVFRQGEFVCMRDADGRPRYIHNADGIIPAGSILLTGTPGGTAIQKPGLFKRLQLFVRGGFSMQGAKERFILDSEKIISDSAYLEVGDRVESWVQYLGRQRWQVITNTDSTSYGLKRSSACLPGSRPNGSLQP